MMRNGCLRRHAHQPAFPVGGEGEARAEDFLGQVGKIGRDLGGGHTRGEVVQHAVNRDAQPTDTGLAAALVRLEGDDLRVGRLCGTRPAAPPVRNLRRSARPALQGRKPPPPKSPLHARPLRRPQRTRLPRLLPTPPRPSQETAPGSVRRHEKATPRHPRYLATQPALRLPTTLPQELEPAARTKSSPGAYLLPLNP